MSVWVAEVPHSMSLSSAIIANIASEIGLSLSHFVATAAASTPSSSADEEDEGDIFDHYDILHSCLPHPLDDYYCVLFCLLLFCIVRVLLLHYLVCVC